MNPDNLLDLITQHGDVAFEEGFAFGQQESELVKTYAHRRAAVFEKIQRKVQEECNNE